MSHVRFGSRLCENAEIIPKTDRCQGAHQNQHAITQMSLISGVDDFNALWAASAAQRASHGRANSVIHALITSSSPATPRILIIRLRL
jgi:hypothetical protein